MTRSILVHFHTSKIRAFHSCLPRPHKAHRVFNVKKREGNRAWFGALAMGQQVVARIVCRIHVLQ